jgi:FlaA1/EpsC-like NDP-sugar epimerase
MEAHLFEAVENNVFGTANVARCAANFGAGDFVLVSSDKAIRPTNVMGATKRLAELVCQMAGQHRGGTRFMAVRFGNVLGSNGSVIPRFRQQIAAGGPVTVTHPEMRRFFMTIPEAAQLVLQAAAMGSGGEIFVLDMGQQIRIVDLARKMVLLSGLRPDRDIRIVFSGIRPGEKLYEEISALEEGTVPTPHSQIRVFAGPPVDAARMQAALRELRRSTDTRNARAIVLCLKDFVEGYNPSAEILKQAFEERGPERARGVVAG